MTPIILEVNLKNIIHNYYEFRKINKKGITAAVVKANAYGTGVNKVSKKLINEGCKDFFVATLQEGIELRKINKKINIYILNGIDKKEIKFFQKNNLVPVVNSFFEYNLIRKVKSAITIILHYDTGMNRLGLNYNQMLYISKNINKTRIKLKYIISHLVSAENINDIYNNIQLKRFNKIKSLYINHKFSLANSAGAFLNDSFHFDMIRPGISLYGGYGRKAIKNKIKSVVKLKAKVIQIRKIYKNESIGYNHTYITKKSKYVATLAIGYGDGIFRNLSNNGYVYFKNFKGKFLGNISMDTSVVDVTSFHNKIKLGDYVEIINKKNDIEIIAKHANTVSQNILTSLGRRIKIEYIE